jgi:heme/copper-type cytochrome/quinol oxidase subunit 2|tara:strand:- start:350 stop:568 length:219 start_codon:yes stop_codon:yes gene_type:complete
MKIRNIFFTVLSLIFGQLLWAQEEPVTAELLNQSNKMIAVIAVLLIILLGITAFLIFMERKISRLEDKMNKK